MLRIVSFVVAVAAIMAIPFSQADARPGGMRSSMGHVSMGGGPRMGGPRLGTFNTIRSRNIIVGSHRIHHRRFPFFVGVGAYGYGYYDGCWRWVPSVYGYRRVWVCDPYGYY